MSNTIQDYMDYTVFADGVDAGRSASIEVAIQMYLDELYSAISDTSKEACGCRIYATGETFADLQAELESWCRSADYAMQEEAEAEARYVEEFKSLVQRTIEMGARNETTALRWLSQDTEFYSGQCIEGFVYRHGILFTDYGKEIVAKLSNIVTFKRAA